MVLTRGLFQWEVQLVLFSRFCGQWKAERLSIGISKVRFQSKGEGEVFEQ